MRKGLFHQSAPHRAPRQFMKLPPQARFAEDEELIGGQLWPGNAEDTLGPAARGAGIDQAITDCSGKGGFNKSHSDLYPRTEVTRIIESLAAI